MNIFDNPRLYRKIILDNNLLKFEKKKFNGKSLICLFLTRFCNVGCPFCFYKSPAAWRSKNIEDQFSDEGIEKFISFANQSNLGYLLVSGGGEPMTQKNHILKIISEVKSDKIVLVTSGNWALHYKTADTYLKEIYTVLAARVIPTTVVIRLSISEGHSIKLGVEPLLNLIQIFESQYQKQNKLILQIKSFENDTTLEKSLLKIPGSELSQNYESYTSDSDLIIKTIYKRHYLTLPSGYIIKVGISPVFNSGHKPDLNNIAALKSTLDVYDHDLRKAECYKPGVIFNHNGENGIDWSINYNGNVAVWQSQLRDNDQNLYEDSYETILQNNLEDPAVYSFMDKGSQYRDNIISEVNPVAILRARAIGLRDSVGAIIFEDERDRLYYTIRVLQDYISEGVITQHIMYSWPSEITHLVQISPQDLQALYKQSTFNFITQQKQKISDQVLWKDLLELIKLNHFALTDHEINDAIDYYNNISEDRITYLSDLIPSINSESDQRRLYDRLTYIKQSVVVPKQKNLELC